MQQCGRESSRFMLLSHVVFLFIKWTRVYLCTCLTRVYLCTCLTRVYLCTCLTCVCQFLAVVWHVSAYMYGTCFTCAFHIYLFHMQLSFYLMWLMCHYFLSHMWLSFYFMWLMCPYFLSHMWFSFYLMWLKCHYFLSHMWASISCTSFIGVFLFTWSWNSKLTRLFGVRLCTCLTICILIYRLRAGCRRGRTCRRPALKWSQNTEPIHPDLHPRKEDDREKMPAVLLHLPFNTMRVTSHSWYGDVISIPSRLSIPCVGPQKITI